MNSLSLQVGGELARAALASSVLPFRAESIASLSAARSPVRGGPACLSEGASATDERLRTPTSCADQPLLHTRHLAYKSETLTAAG